MDKSLNITPNMLAVFIDETGNEDFSDPNFPIFGCGGCAIVGSSYQRVIEKPWRALKKQILGGESKPFHAVEFGQSSPSKEKINAINAFVKGKFHRFFACAHINTSRPETIDGHKTVFISLIPRIQKIVRSLMIDSISLIFEHSDRGNSLVERDINLMGNKMVNRFGLSIKVDGYFLDKKSMTAGLELADLIVHTAGRQARLMYTKEDESKIFKPDYSEVFHHGINDLADGLFVTSVNQNR